MAKRKPVQNHYEHTQFKDKWGVLAHELAEQDGVTTDAIHMRVMKFGTPWQRKSKPTKWERMYAKNMYELAHEFGIHPTSVALRHYRLGNIYATPVTATPDTQVINWLEVNKWRYLTWLHPNHPDYAKWRSGELFAQEYIKKPDDFVTL